MAVSSLPGIGFTLTLPNTTTVVAVDDPAFGANAVAVPDNCRAIVVYNLSAANRILVQFQRTAEIGAGLSILNSIVLPSLSSITFAVGYVGDRPVLFQNGETDLYMQAETGTNVQVNISYLQGRGSDLF
jgi:hypothetical protein